MIEEYLPENYGCVAPTVIADDSNVAGDRMRSGSRGFAQSAVILEGRLNSGRWCNRIRTSDRCARFRRCNAPATSPDSEIERTRTTSAKESPAVNPSDLPIALRSAYLALHRRTEEQFAPLGVTADQFVLLSTLANAKPIGSLAAGGQWTKRRIRGRQAGL